MLAFLLLFSALMIESVSAAENFKADNHELSSSSPKDVKYSIKAEAKTSLWAMNFKVVYDSDVFSLDGISCDSRFALSYTENEDGCTVLLYASSDSNVSLSANAEVLCLSYTVRDGIQPGAYRITFEPLSVSMITYTGTVKDTAFDGGKLFYGNKVTYIVDGSEHSSLFAAAGDTIIPDDVYSDNFDEKFIGWYSPKNSSHGKVFISPGESFTLGNYDIALEALFLEIKTLPGASVYFPSEKDDIRLRFISAVNKSQYDFIMKNVLENDSSAMILGTLICPTDYVNLNEGMNFDALKNDRYAVQTSSPMAPGAWLDDDAVAAIGGNNKYYYYEGILSDILREPPEDSTEIINCDTKFSALAYLTLTYPGGKTVDHFAEYDSSSHSRSVREVVTRALDDVSQVKTDYYRFKIDDIYRPYSPEQTAALYKIRAGM